MASYESRRERERRRRAKVRRKVTVTAIIMLIIGIIIGFLINDLLYEGKFGDKVIMEQPLLATATPYIEVTAAPTPTAVPTEVPTEAPTAEPAVVYVEVTPEPTAEPTAEPVVVYVEVTPEATEVPTVAPTAVPTEAPTEVPTVVPTAVPTEVPTVAPTEAPVVTAEPVVEATVEATVEAAAAVATEAPAESAVVEVVETVEVTAEEAVVEETADTNAGEPVVIPFGQSYTFETQINQDGSSRRTADDAAYETLNLTLTVTDYKDHDYYVDTYTGKYKIKGNEAALEFRMTLNDYAGTTTIQPQEFLLITFRNEAGETVEGYQITDAEIAGQVGVTLLSDVSETMYKRYPFSAEQGDMDYMVVTTFNDGVESEYWFQMVDPIAEAAKAKAEAEEAARIEAESKMTIGSEGENVKQLQAKLIELNLLSGSPDGKFGKYTAEAVKVLQGRYGMEQTGVTSKEFLDKLYE